MRQFEVSESGQFGLFGLLAKLSSQDCTTRYAVELTPKSEQSKEKQ
jgi:hypothetical protein